MNNIKGLAPNTYSIIERVSKLECIKPYTLVGGTALSIQLATRESEDLDFMSWRKSKTEKREVDWPKVKNEFEGIGTVTDFDLLDLDHIEFKVDGVKISFYANPNYSPVEKEVEFLNNIKLADLKSIGAMKMEVLLRRSKFRDYYDIYSLLEAGIDINEMMILSIKYSGHRLKSKNLLSILSKSNRFVEEPDFESLNPIYDVTAVDIENRIRKALKDNQ